MNDFDEALDVLTGISRKGRETDVTAPPSDDDGWLNNIENAIQAGHLDQAAILLDSARTSGVNERFTARMQLIREQHRSARKREALLGHGSLIMPDHPYTKTLRDFRRFEERCRIAQEAWAEYEAAPALDTPEKKRFRLQASIIDVIF